MNTPTEWKPCGCKARIEKSLLTHYATQLAPSEAIACELMGFGFQVTERGLEQIPLMPFEVTYRYTAKRTGAVSTKIKKGNFHLNYCPFCGQPANRKTAEHVANSAGKPTAMEHAA